MTENHEHLVIELHYKLGRARIGANARWECLSPVCTEPDGDVTQIFGHPMGREYGYAPLDCPSCGRHRLLYLVTTKRVIVYCEKCGAREWDCEQSEHGHGKPHPQKASAWVNGMGVG